MNALNREIPYLPITELAGLIRTKELSPVTVTQSILDRIHQLNPLLRAYFTVFEDQAMIAAKDAEREIARGDYRGPLHGVPIAIKDLFELGPTTAGSELRRHYVADRDAAAVRRLKKAGAVLVGKLATHEFALGAATLDGGFPAARNPWRPDLSPGGSSSGAGVAVAAGMAYGALASDTGGSIRLPASYCGVVGLKPSYGRVSREGLFPLSWSLDHVGPITRRVEDAMEILAACSTTPVGNLRNAERTSVDRLRIGVPWRFFQDICSPEILSAFEGAVEHMRRLGALVSDVEIGITHTVAWAAFYLITLPEAAAYHFEDLRLHPTLYGREFRLLLRAGQLLSATTYIQAQRARSNISRQLDNCLIHHDVLMLPTVGSKAESIPSGWRPLSERMKRLPAPLFTPLFNLAGVPAISIPCGFSIEGLPIGLQFASRRFDELAVLRAAEAYESTTDWKDRRPGSATSPSAQPVSQ